MLTVLTPATSSALVALATLRAELGITGSAEDATLERFIRQASAIIASHCARPGFGRESLRQTDRLDSPRGAIVLERDLAPAVSGVTEDGIALDAALWELDGTLLYRLTADGRRRPWCAAVVVTLYTAGFVLPDEAPADLERACLVTCSAWHAALGRDPMLRSEATEGVGSTSWIASADTGALPPQAMGALTAGGWCRTVIG